MNNILVLNLTKENFDRIISGNKRIEYRECKPYWRKRIFPTIITPFKYIRFVKGYTSNYSFMYKIDKIVLISYEELPDYAQQFFTNKSSCNFYAIHFSNCKLSDSKKLRVKCE